MCVGGWVFDDEELESQMRFVRRRAKEGVEKGGGSEM